MTTTALVGNKPHLGETRGTSAFAPTQKPTRQIVREEIERQKQLDKLEEKYNNGEISKFEYQATKWMLNLPVIMDKIQPRPEFSTTA